ncbi:hypothetical protein N8T08_009481 [Aspergillus melleus]|uniref:Uncharacterized protein n=1 Tax=Aspergillus melleus TaxID=138277 RepID=A0ACC3BDU3_9EURO|nr:hypothetical protein N8T08_009481 [Aspergillus melleus]
MSDIEPSWGKNPRQTPVNLTNFSFKEYRTLKDEILQFLSGGPCFLAALQTLNSSGPYYAKGYKVDPKSKDDRGFTPLHYAACKGYTDVVQYLIDIGADVNSYSDHGVSALSCAAMYAHEEVVRVLCDRGANVNSADFVYHQTPLIFAVIGCDEFVVRMILQKGALVDVEDKSGRTALGRAADQGKEAIAKILYQAIIGDPNVLSRHHSLYGKKPLSENGRALMAGIVGQHRR